MKNILLVVDMQNGFARNDQTKEVGKKIAKLLNSNIFDYTIATQFINLPQGPYKRIIKWKRLSESPETDLLEGIKTDYVFKKYVYTAVNKEIMETIIKLNDGEKPDYIFVAGVDTDCCVMKTAADLFEQDIRPIVLLNYCNSNGGEVANQAGIQVMKRLIGEEQLVKSEINSKSDIQNIIQCVN